MTSKGLEDAPRHTLRRWCVWFSGGVRKRKVFVGDLGSCWKLGFVYLIFWKVIEKQERDRFHADCKGSVKSIIILSNF